MIKTTSGGAMAAPRRLALCVSPWTKPRSSRGYQSCIERVAPGKAPASPTLKDGIGPDKGAEDRPHRDLVKAKLIANNWGSRRDIDPVQVGDEVHQAN